MAVIAEINDYFIKLLSDGERNTYNERIQSFTEIKKLIKEHGVLIKEHDAAKKDNVEKLQNLIKESIEKYGKGRSKRYAGFLRKLSNDINTNKITAEDKKEANLLSPEIQFIKENIIASIVASLNKYIKDLERKLVDAKKLTSPDPAVSLMDYAKKAVIKKVSSTMFDKGIVFKPKLSEKKLQVAENLRSNLMELQQFQEENVEGLIKSVVYYLLNARQQNAVLSGESALGGVGKLDELLSNHLFKIKLYYPEKFEAVKELVGKDDKHPSIK